MNEGHEQPSLAAHALKGLFPPTGAGLGIMTEAGRAVVEWLRSNPEICRTWATCHVNNLASARILEKLGMEREGVLRRWNRYPNLSPEPQDSLVYAWVRNGVGS